MLDSIRTRVNGSQPSTSLGLDDVHDVLQNERRRRILDHLDGRAWTIGDLAERMASDELDKPVELLDSQERKRLYVALFQTHLPKLAGLGIVVWEDERGPITRGPEYAGVRAIQLDARGAVQGGSD